MAGSRVDPVAGKPHDRLVRALFEREEDARAVLALLLPERLLAGLDLSSIGFEPDSFVEDRLKGKFSDLVLRVRASSGQEGRLYLMVEHFRDPPARPPLVALSAVVRLVERLDRQHPKRRGPLPWVRAVVIHQADRPYRGPRRMEDLFGDDPGGELLEGVPTAENRSRSSAADATAVPAVAAATAGSRRPNTPGCFPISASQSSSWPKRSTDTPRSSRHSCWPRSRRRRSGWSWCGPSTNTAAWASA
jgi:hypothetical protein